jgi:hypothetical protein
VATARIELSLGENAADPLVLSIEPWGEDYTFRSNATIEVRAWNSGAEPPWFHLHLHPLAVWMVYPENAEGFAVFEGGVRVECGHGRE